MKNVRAIVLSMAAMCQACVLVDKLSYGKSYDDNDIKILSQALFIMEAKNVEEIYPNLNHLQTGLLQLKSVLSPSKSRNKPQLIRYMLGLIVLGQKFLKHKKMPHEVRQRLEAAKRQLQHFDASHPVILAQLGDIYMQTLSQLPYRIYVQGEATKLKETQVALNIRAILLCGLRASVLWAQMGGSRLQFLFNKKTMLNTCLELIELSKIHHNLPLESEHVS